MVIRRGDIYYADLRPVVGSEQGGVRPVLIIQNDMGNRHSPTVICAAITSRMSKAKLPTHVVIDSRCCSIVKDSVVLLEQLRTIDKQRLRRKSMSSVGRYDPPDRRSQLRVSLVSPVHSRAVFQIILARLKNT